MRARGVRAFSRWISAGVGLGAAGTGLWPATMEMDTRLKKRIPEYRLGLDQMRRAGRTAMAREPSLVDGQTIHTWTHTACPRRGMSRLGPGSAGIAAHMVENE